MLGHEGVRRLTEAHLAALLPAELGRIRAATPPVDVDNEPAVWPPNPSVFCSDTIPNRSDRLPAVMVGSSQMLSLKAEESGIGPVWRGRYQFDINVLVVSPHAGGDTLASIGRDRLVLAVIKLLLRTPDTGHGVVLLTRDLVSETGPAREDEASRPIAAGVITVQADTEEFLDEDSIPIDSITTDVTVVDASQPLPS